MSINPKPRLVDTEYVFHNPQNESNDPTYEFKFDVYTELQDGRKIAIEIDGKVGHSSKRSFHKREAKIVYLASKGIELYAFPTNWIVSRHPLHDSLILSELGLLQ